MRDVSALDYDELGLLAEVRRIVERVAELVGDAIPAVGSAQWWDAEPMARVAGLLVLAEARLIDDPDALAAEQLKAMSVAISSGLDWSANAHRLICEPHAVLAARRREPGPLAGMAFDAEREARWVATGSSEDGDVAA